MYKHKPIIYLEHLINGQWVFYCYIVPCTNNYGTVKSTWNWCRELLKKHPDEFRIIPSNAMEVYGNHENRP